jgi:hypothetical protein
VNSPRSLLPAPRFIPHIRNSPFEILHAKRSENTGRGIAAKRMKSQFVAAIRRIHLEMKEAMSQRIGTHFTI